MGEDGHDSMTPSERRIGVRHFACFPAHVHRPDGTKRTAMIHDLSVSGALLVVRTILKLEDRISLTLYVTQFDEALTDFEDEIKALAEHQRKLGLKP
jgi:hypothetical protein